MPRARTGVNERVDEYGLPEDIPILHLSLPTAPPERMYLLFQKPIRLTKEDAADREKCNKVYAEVKG